MTNLSPYLGAIVIGSCALILLIDAIKRARERKWWRAVWNLSAVFGMALIAIDVWNLA